MEPNDIILRKIIVHVLDTSKSKPVLSEGYVDTDREELNDFLHKHIYRLVTSDEKKECVFSEDSEIYALLKNFNEDSFTEISVEIAEKLFMLMKENPSIPPADLVLATYQCKSQPYLAILKMNYRENYVHFTRELEGQRTNELMIQRAALPISKLSEAVLIDLTVKSVSVIEKKYEINGEKEYYLSNDFLKCHAKMSPKTKLKLVEKTIRDVNKQFFEEDVEKQMEVKAIIEKEFREEGTLDTQQIGAKLYENQPEVQNVFLEKLEKNHIDYQTVEPENEATIKSYQSQHLKTDTGIEIRIPMEQYHDPSHFEFISNEDGTISLMIKNISRLVSK